MLLGTTPIEADPEYGWIVPGAARADGTMEVESFAEKPGMADYERLRRRGAMCNTFVLVASVRAVCERYYRVRPGLLKKFLWRLRWHEHEDEALEKLHATAPCLDFGRDLLEPSEQSLRLVPVPPCGWADLGTPARLQAWARAMRGRVGAIPLFLWVPDCGGALNAVPIGSRA
jgi:mannose-1-phosphate guanylyltransferase